MATPFSFNGTLTFAPDLGVAECPLPFTGSDNFDEKKDLKLPLSGAGSVVVTLSSAVKGLLIEVDAANPAATINLRFNAGSEDLELSTSGFLAYFSPNPSTGITQVEIIHTVDVTVRLRALA